MQATPRIPERDPEFTEPVQPRLLEIDHAPESYLRLVANPFLGVAGLLAWMGLIAWLARYIFAEPDAAVFIPVAAIAMIALLFLAPRLFHYHCLDCGATGRLSRWRRHVCSASSERRRQGRPRRLRGPSPPTQLLLWLWGLLVVGFVLAQYFG